MQDDVMQEGDLIKVEIEIRLPKTATIQEVTDWLRFNLLQSGSISQSNPLYHECPEDFGPFGLDWEFTGEKGRKEEYGHEPTENGGVKYKVKYIREKAA
jgi:hypothetical protein